MEEISGSIVIILIILALAFFVTVLVLIGKCQVLTNHNLILERQVKKMQDKNDALESRVKAQSLIIKKLSE